MEEAYEALENKTTAIARKQTKSPEKSKLNGHLKKLSRKVAEAVANYQTTIDRTVNNPTMAPPQQKFEASF